MIEDSAVFRIHHQAQEAGKLQLTILVKQQCRIHPFCYSLCLLVEGSEHNDFLYLELLAASHLLHFLFCSVSRCIAAGVNGKIYIFCPWDVLVRFALQVHLRPEIYHHRNRKAFQICDVCVRSVGQMGRTDEQACFHTLASVHLITAQVP